jgi:hypothetical protein
MLQGFVLQAQQRLASTADMVKTESEKLLELERAHELRHQQAQQQARVALLRKEWAEKQSQQLRDVLDAESDLQQQMLTLQRASMKAEINQNLVASASVGGGTGSIGDVDARDVGLHRLNNIARVDASAMAAARTEIEQLGDEIYQRQRNRFEEMQRELSRQRGSQPNDQGPSRGKQTRSSVSSDTDRHYDSTANESSPTGAKANANPRWFASPEQPVPHTLPQRAKTGSKVVPQKAATASNISNIDFAGSTRRSSDSDSYSRSYRSGGNSDVSPESETTGKSGRYSLPWISCSCCL